MKHHLNFGGHKIEEICDYISSSDRWVLPTELFESVTIPGSNGQLHVTSNTYDNVNISYTCAISNRLNENLIKLSNALNSVKGYQKLTDDYEPDIYRMARVIEMPSIEPKRAKYAHITIHFNCKPQKYLVSGEQMHVFSGSDTLENPTLYNAKPIIKVYGTGTFKINNVPVTVLSPGTEFIEIDCETLNAYEGLDNRNSNVSRLRSDLCLKPGENSVLVESGISKIEIVPRWWRL